MGSNPTPGAKLPVRSIMAKKHTTKKTVWYRQCRYSSPTEEGKTVGVAWIPEHLAVVGKTIYFGKKTDKPERLWTVESVGGRMEEEVLRDRERDYLHQRKASDI